MLTKQLRARGFQYCERLFGDYLKKSLPVYLWCEIGDYIFCRIEAWPRPRNLSPDYFRFKSAEWLDIPWKRVWINKTTGEVESYDWEGSTD